MPGYSFELTATDGNLLPDSREPGRFRIVIWRVASGDDGSVVYDNQVDPDDGTPDEGAVLGGGSIVIRQKAWQAAPTGTPLRVRAR